MNLNEEDASHWRGRILMKIFTRDDKNPVMKTNKIYTREIRALLHQTLIILV